MAVAKAPNASSTVVSYTSPNALAFSSTGALANGVLAITSPCPSFTAQDCTTYPPGSLADIEFSSTPMCKTNFTKSQPETPSAIPAASFNIKQPLLEHLLDHQPPNPECPACCAANMRDVQHFRHARLH